MAHTVKILDNFIKDSKTSTIPQWIVFSAVRCLYENNIDHYAEIATSEAPLKKKIPFLILEILHYINKVIILILFIIMKKYQLL